MEVVTVWSNGNSFSNGQGMDAGGSRGEPWLTSGLLRPVQDRGGI